MNENQYPESVADICDAAADFIETHGWHQGHATAAGARDQWRPGVAVCAAGAVAGVCGQLGNYDYDASRHHRAGTAIAAVEALVGSGLIENWNDDPSRTQDEVIQALRDTATKHRSDEMRVGGRSEPS